VTAVKTKPKTTAGNFFDSFHLGQEIRHATPRTVTTGDVAIYNALYGARFALQTSDEFARGCGLARSPMDDICAFHIIFGKTVPDVSINAMANLGYADCRFLKPLYPGDTINTVTKVIGLKQNSNGKTGIVYVRSTGYNQRKETVLDYVRWVMVYKKDPASPAPDPVVPDLPSVVSADSLVVPEGLDFSKYDTVLGGSEFLWEDYETGEKIDHVDGRTIAESEHMMATRISENNARIHFDDYGQKPTRYGQRLVFGGHVISTARALSYNGLANACFVAAINGGRHVNPSFGGDTVYCWSEILDKAEIKGRRDVGALRVRTVATKDRACADFPGKTADGEYDSSVTLDLDYWVFMPRRV
jgi:2-methylfumaryl-CoA hydratase